MICNNNEWFKVFKPKNNASLRLFCFHFGGGSASVYRGWVNDMPEFVELVAIQMPGREDRFNESLLSNISQVIDKLCLNFNGYGDKPFIFFGHSIGALIAFEFARTLKKQKMPQPKHLIVSGTKAPQVPLERKPIHNLADAEFIKELKKYNGTPDYILKNEELMSIFLPILRADFSISETYQYINEEPLDCPITALGGNDDDTFNSDNLIKWQKQTTRSFQYYFLPGDHFFIKRSYGEVMRIVNQVIYN